MSDQPGRTPPGADDGTTLSEFSATAVLETPGRSPSCSICGRELHHDARLGWLDVMNRTNCPDDPSWRLHTPETGPARTPTPERDRD